MFFLVSFVEKAERTEKIWTKLEILSGRTAVLQAPLFMIKFFLS